MELVSKCRAGLLMVPGHCLHFISYKHTFKLKKGYQDIERRLYKLNERKISMKHKLADKNKELQEAIQYYLFERDADELLGWINEKLKNAQNDDYIDVSQAKQQKHQNFQSELQTHQQHLDAICKCGQDLLDSNNYAASKIQDKLDSIRTSWTRLVDASNKKSVLLKQAYDALQYNRNLEDVDLWLNEIELQLNNDKDDLGKDLASVHLLQKKLQHIESDINARKERIEQLKALAKHFNDQDHFDSKNLTKKQEQIVQRFHKLFEPIDERRKKLYLSLKLQQLYRDIDDEESWIREKEPTICTSNMGRDLIGVQNLVKKHQTIQAEIQGHEPRIRKTCNEAEDMINNEHYALSDIKKRCTQLQSKWQLLKDNALKRKVNLDNALQIQQYLTDASETESWMKEKEPLVSSLDYGKDEDTAEVKKINNLNSGIRLDDPMGTDRVRCENRTKKSFLTCLPWRTGTNSFHYRHRVNLKRKGSFLFWFGSKASKNSTSKAKNQVEKQEGHLVSNINMYKL